MTQQELDQLQQKTLAQFKDGKFLFGKKDGAFAPMFKQFLEVTLHAETDAPLSEQQLQSGDKRNGKGTKTIKSSGDSFQIDPKKLLPASDYQKAGNDLSR